MITLVIGGRRLRWLLLAAVAYAAALLPPHASSQPAFRRLRACAGPDNLPFSNDLLEGFENRLMELVARELGASLEYTWSSQRRGSLRRTLQAGKCDVIPGIPAGTPGIATTRPYYRSSDELDIAMGVRRDDRALLGELDAILARRRAEVNHVLDWYVAPGAE